MARTIHGRTIRLSNLDKVFFPGAGITKGDVVEYYARVAEVMLPHVKGRPVSMHRWPDGIGGEGFFQKETPDWFPDWIATATVEKTGGTIRAVVIEEPAALPCLAQQACLVPHVWTSRADRPRRPDRIVFDLDPPGASPEDAFDAIRRAARDLRAVLDDLGLRPFVATSGSRGLHVHVPIRRHSDFDEAGAFARDVARLLAARQPGELTVAQRKDQRRGRIYIDHLRNAYGQTAVAPYALRALPGAPVATPLEWDELSRSGMNPRRYTLENLFRRLGARDDPWKSIDDHAERIDGARRTRLDALLNEAR